MGQEHGPIEVAILAAFLFYRSVQVLVPSDKNFLLILLHKVRILYICI